MGIPVAMIKVPKPEQSRGEGEDEERNEIDLHTEPFGTDRYIDLLSYSGRPADSGDEPKPGRGTPGTGCTHSEEGGNRPDSRRRHHIFMV